MIDISNHSLKNKRGALVRRSTDSTGYASGTMIPFEVESYDTDGFWDIANPTKLVIPSGISVVRFFAALRKGTVTSVSAPWGFSIAKNGVVTWFASSALKLSMLHDDEASGTQRLIPSTPPIDVVAGDYFELYMETTNASLVVNGSSNMSYFGLEVLQ
jgi:hypothetical protein